MTKKNELMTVEEVALLLRMSEPTVRRLAASTQLPGAIKVGGQWRFNRAELTQWLEAAER